MQGLVLLNEKNVDKLNFSSALHASPFTINFGVLFKIPVSFCTFSWHFPILKGKITLKKHFTNGQYSEKKIHIAKFHNHVLSNTCWAPFSHRVQN